MIIDTVSNLALGETTLLMDGEAIMFTAILIGCIARFELEKKRSLK